MIKTKAVIIDLDGTLCNSAHRSHLAQAKKWDEFFQLMHLDEPNHWCLDLVHALYRTNQYEIIFLTGRNDGYRQITVDWLARHTMIRKEHVNLLMRPKGDHRHDDVLKAEIFREQLEPNYRVMFAVDDRARVITMWRKLGVVALQCDDWEEQTPHVAQEIHQHFIRQAAES